MQPRAFGAKVSIALLLSSRCFASPGLEIAGNVYSEGASSASSSLRGASASGWLQRLPDLPGDAYRWIPALAVMDIRVRQGVGLSDADPLWKEAADLIRSAAYASEPGKKFMDLCSAGNLSQYASDACAPGTLGAVLVRGVPMDAYFCGSKESGIDWHRSYWDSYNPPVKNVCDAQPMTAYDATGICGRWSTKQLVQSFFYVTPLWSVDPVTINAPGLHCLLGLGNCDIYYCQHCAGRCGPA
mmetsp:Transcript_173840/g.422797  ORF Transcript_173840/g.422797 Transcript_173840/m.422797 type:complete len:242 (+) Transcript_173840:97-822(+)